MGRDGDGLYKRGRIWYFRYRDASGRWPERSTHETNYGRAREVRQAFLERLKAGQVPTDLARATLGEALQHRLEFLKATGARSSKAPYQTSVRHLIRLLGSARKLESINIIDIQRYQIARSNEATRGRRTSPKTINNELLLLIAVLKQAKLWRAMQEDYKPLRVPKKGPGIALSPEEGEALFSKAFQKDCWEVALCCGVLAYSAGCRSYEIKSLQLSDIRLDRRALLIRRENTKSDAGAREVALNELAFWAVDRLLRRARLLGATEPHHYLLPAQLSKHTKSGDPAREQRGYDPNRHQQSWSSAWESLRKSAGLPNLRFHDLRHTFITQAVEAGVPVEVIKSQVGHMSQEMVAHYTHLGTQAKAKAAARVAENNSGLASILAASRPPTIG